jgi:hypothetical protein
MSNASGTKTLTSNFPWRMCGLDMYPSEYEKNFCSKRYTDNPNFYKNRLFEDNIFRKNNWAISRVNIPFISDIRLELPFYEYRQCFRYCQSLFAVLLRVSKSSNKRFLNVKIYTVIPSSYDFTSHFFYYNATEYCMFDILKLKNTMNSIDVWKDLEHFRIYGEILFESENYIVEKGIRYSPENVVQIAKKIFNSNKP